MIKIVKSSFARLSWSTSQKCIESVLSGKLNFTIFLIASNILSSEVEKWGSFLSGGEKGEGKKKGEKKQREKKDKRVRKMNRWEEKGEEETS